MLCVLECNFCVVIADSVLHNYVHHNLLLWCDSEYSLNAVLPKVISNAFVEFVCDTSVVMCKVHILQKLNAKDLIKLNFFKNAEGILFERCTVFSDNRF